MEEVMRWFGVVPALICLPALQLGAQDATEMLNRIKAMEDRIKALEAEVQSLRAAQTAASAVQSAPPAAPASAAGPPQQAVVQNPEAPATLGGAGPAAGKAL